MALARNAVDDELLDMPGTLPGEMSVGPTGQLSYAVPLSVPPGRAGMEPAVSLVYSSLAGNGPVGIGWSIGGFASIRRCNRTVHLDGHAEGVDFDEDDAFCLDGERLDPVDGESVPHEYRTRLDRYARITPGGYNARWEAFISTNPGVVEIYQFAGRMMDDYGLAGLPIVPYR